MSTSPKTIWILEDEEGARYVYENVFDGRYAVKFFSSIEEMHAFLPTGRPDLMLCDLLLQGESFLSFLESPRASLIEGIPFLVVSALDDTEALRKCFAKGAIDYITKPFGKGELLVKTEFILNRSDSGPMGPYRKPPGLRVDPNTMRAYHGEASSALLTAKEFQILSLLQQAPQHSVTRNEIVQMVWGSVKVGSKTLNVHIFNLRRKLSPLQVEIAFEGPNYYCLAYK